MSILDTKKPYIVLPVQIKANDYVDLSPMADYVAYVSLTDMNGSPIDVNTIEVSIDNTPTVPMPAILPSKVTFKKITLINTNNFDVILTLVFGYETYFVQTQTTTIVRDLVGLAKDANLTGTKTLTFLNVNVGTTATQITTTSTLINMLLIQNNSASDVYLGSSSLQNIKIPANGGVITITLPMNFKVDLSTLYLISSTSVTVAVMYA
jgi:hypothetical protein